MYDVWLYFSTEHNSDNLESALIDAAKLSVWTGVEHPRLLKTILQIDGLVAVGLVHCYRRPFAPTQDFAAYSLAIYPPHYVRALGGPISGVKGPNFEKWEYLDPERVRLFHKALFGLIRKFADTVPIFGASINTEDRGFAQPYCRDGSICVSPNVARILGLDAKPLPNSHSMFVSVRPKV